MKTVVLTLVGIGLAAAVMVGSGLAASRTHSVQLAIVHVEAGCHTWATGKLQPPAMSVRLKRGGQLHIVNQDVDAHRLVQIAGPKVGRDMVMMMNHRMQIAFPKAGVYRFKTVVVEMPGMTEVETKGPDHNLFLTVKVT